MGRIPSDLTGQHLESSRQLNQRKNEETLTPCGAATATVEMKFSYHPVHYGMGIVPTVVVCHAMKT